MLVEQWRTVRVSFDWIVPVVEIVLFIAIMFFAALTSKVVAVASLFICLSSGVMLWMMTDLATDPSYGFAIEDYGHLFFWLVFTIPNVAAVGALAYSLGRSSYGGLLIAAAMSSISLLFPFGILAGVLLRWGHKRNVLFTP
ncbi:MAG: hypothetical protein MUO81_04675 [Thermoplasmata archaeon]|nr:hypothetical protein [Thermoplasmata archaeon]